MGADADDSFGACQGRYSACNSAVLDGCKKLCSGDETGTHCLAACRDKYGFTENISQACTQMAEFGESMKCSPPRILELSEPKGITLNATKQTDPPTNPS